jgi:YaiO family outer membrane protein
MKSTSKLMLCLLFSVLCIKANAQWLKKTESSDDLYKEAKREIELKHYQKAINLCNKAIDISPRNLDIYLLLGRSFALAGKVDSARIQLNYVLQKSPKYKDAYIYLINIEVVACNYAQALEYADMGLKQFPNDRDILLKKLDIYNKEGDWIESNKLSEYIFDRFSQDSYVRSIYLDYKLTLARQYSHRGYIEIAKHAYESVLEQDPLNKEALQAVFALDVRSGNYESSLAYTNRALQSTPNSYEFLIKKISILDAMSRYVEAIGVVEKLLKLFPSNPEVQKMNIYLRMEAGRYFMNTDPYLQFQAVLDKEPSNRDALNYVINIAYSRGLLNDVINWTNIGLKRYPNDRELLTKKMGALEGLKKYGTASSLAESIYKNSPSPANKASFIELRTLSAKQFINDMDYDSAAIALKSVLFYDHSNITAINYLISAYTLQKRYDDALHTIDEALTYYPGDERLLYKKAGVLESYQKYAEAAMISKQLLQKYPNSRQYLVSFVEQSLEAGRQSLQYDDYYGTVGILRDVLEKQPDNVDALNYMINIESSFKQYDSALYYCDQALRYYPDNRDFQLKKSSVYADAKQYKEAYAISGVLYANYPYNNRFRNAYMDQLLASGKQYLGNDEPDSALVEFYKALAIAPTDTTTLSYTINLLIGQDQLDTASALIERGRAMYPNNPFFLMKRAVLLEKIQDWEGAWRAADTLAKMTPLDQKLLDYSRYLYSRRLRNEFGLSYLRSKIMDTTHTNLNSVATAQYTRRFRKGSITARVNYAGRFIGTAFQYEAEAYYNVTPKWYIFGIGAFSDNNIIFPKYRFGLSLYHAFPRGYEGEIGARYLQATLGGNIVSGLAGIGREINDFYFNLRGYLINLTRTDNTTDQYYSAILTSRWYLNNRTEYFSAIAGYGTAPDDFSINYDLSRVLAYNTISVGAGYSRQIQYRTTLGIFGSWYNMKTGADINGNGTYRNQYDIYVTLLRKF